MKFKLFDIEFELQFIAVAVITLILIFDSSSKVVVCVLCALIHECGHILAMLCFSIKPKAIKLRLFDIAIIEDNEKSELADLIITIAGPVVNLICACIFYYFSTTLFVCNLSLCVFNMLPIDTFDGGHALYLLLSKKLSFKTVTIVQKVLTLILLVPILVVGIMVLIDSKHNYSLLLIALYLLTILFIK